MGITEPEKKFRQTWRNVVYRCTNPKDSKYTYYSKIGIVSRWLTYENFREDMLQSFISHVEGHGMENTTIDRIDNTKGYTKENCRWATWEVQRRKRRMITRGYRVTSENLIKISKMAKIWGISKNEALRRIIGEA